MSETSIVPTLKMEFSIEILEILFCNFDGNWNYKYEVEALEVLDIIYKFFYSQFLLQTDYLKHSII